MPNQFYVAPPDGSDALQSFMQSYKGVNDIRTQMQTQAARQQAAQQFQSGDTQGALARLMGAGDIQGAAIASQVLNQRNQTQFHQDQLTETSRHNRANEGVAQEGLNKPTVVPWGAGLVNRKGDVVREPGSNETGILDEPTLTAMAHQYRAGDTSVLTNLGRGAQGAANVVALRKKIADLNSQGGETGVEQASRNAEFFGNKAGQRTLGTKQANIELASTEFKQVLPVVIAASNAVNRTNYPDLNKIIQAAQEKTGDPNIVKFGGGVNTLINVYARAISPTGVPSVSDKDHAREILQKAWSQGQFNAATDMMTQEIDAALKSPEKVRDDMRKRFLGGVGGAGTQQRPAQQQFQEGDTATHPSGQKIRFQGGQWVPFQ